MMCADEPTQECREKLYKILQKVVKNRDSRLFLESFNELLQDSKRFDNVERANKVISGLRTDIFKTGNSFSFTLNDEFEDEKKSTIFARKTSANTKVEKIIEEIYFVEELLHKARTMISQKSENLQFLDKLSASWNSSDIIEIGEQILTSYTEEELHATLDQNLLRTNIRSCTIVKYSDPSTDEGRSTGRVTYHINMQNDYKADNKLFETSLLIPEYCWPDDKKQQLLLSTLPLYNEKESLGYVVFQYTKNLGQMLTIFASNIASAYRAIDIYQEQQRAENEIRERSERVNALVIPMLESIMQINKVSSREIETIKNLSEITGDGLEKLKMVNDIISQASSNITNMLKMIDIIDELSSNINILAINASIESAHAGEYGLGFQVIAQEVQQLSDSTAKNAKEISETLKNIVNSIQDSMLASKENFSIFSNVKSHVEEVTALLTNILTTMTKLSNSSNDILKEYK